MCTNTFQLHPSDKQSHFKVNDCTEQKTLSIHLELIQWFTVETPSNFGRMFRICFFFPRERFQKKYIYPFKWSRYHPMVQKFYCERYLSIQSMLGKKEKKYQHFNIFDYTYLPKTDICLFFFLFFLWTFPYAYLDTASPSSYSLPVNFYLLPV